MEYLKFAKLAEKYLEESVCVAIEENFAEFQDGIAKDMHDGTVEDMNEQDVKDLSNEIAKSISKSYRLQETIERAVKEVLGKFVSEE